MQAWESLRFFGHRLLDALWPARKTRATLRAAWGRPGDKHTWLESDYFDLVRDRAHGSVVDDRTWLDLEYPRIFRDMDTTLTPIGSQWLYHRLRACSRGDEDPRSRYETFETLRTQASLRERIQLRLKPLEDDANADIAAFLLDAPPQPMKHRGLIAWWGLASLAVFLGVIVQGWPWWIWLGTVAVNGLVFVYSSRFLFRDVTTLKGCVHMMQVSEQVAAIDTGGRSLPAMHRLRAQAPDRRRVRTALKWFVFMHRPLVSRLRVWLNLFFLVEVSIYNLTFARFLRVRALLVPTFEALGELDGSIAVAGYLQRHPEHCQPEWCEDQELALVEARHPLLDDPVPNSIALSGQSVLVTGSNMAGKTTFIKSVGLQLLLGQTLGLCLAREARVPRVRVMAAIRGDHSVASGKSHYFAEVESIRAFIDLHERGVPAVFLIDELFSGTNTVERIAAARAVLDCLSRRAIVLVTTHDVELQALMPDRFVLCHFQENPDIEGFFDYRLRHGRATERNAIRLLERMSFPERVIADALSYIQDS